MDPEDAVQSPGDEGAASATDRAPGASASPPEAVGRSSRSGSDPAGGDPQRGGAGVERQKAPNRRPSPRPRTPRSAAAAAATPTTASPRPARARPTVARSTTSRSASTGSAARTRRKAAVPPERRATAADALVEIPEPPITTEPEPPIAPEHTSAPVETPESDDVAAPTADIGTVPPSDGAAPTFAELGIDLPTAPRAPAEPEPVSAPQLTGEAHPELERAADAAFSDLVGSRSLPTGRDTALELTGLTKRYGAVTAVDGIDLRIPVGSFYGIVGPNGAGKTTTLSMATGMIRPDGGRVAVLGHDLQTDAAAAKRALGVLPDRLRLFDRLTGAQLLHYAGSLRGLDRATIGRRSRDLAVAFGLASSLARPVSDYSVGMTKKIAIAAALIHAPRMLVLDEPFESVDPVSAASVLHVLRRFTDAGGTVVLSSHSMELIESTCDSLAIIVAGRILAAGPTAEVLSGVTLEDRFVELAGGRSAVEGMEWLHSYAADA